MSDWSALVHSYETFLVDLVGVVHDGISAFPEAIQALNQLPSHKTLIFASNNPRPSALSLNKLRDYGLTRDFTVITSGDFARAQLQLDSQNTYYHWGAARNTDILAGIPLKLTENIQAADKVLLTAFIEEQEDPHQFDPLIAQILQQQLPVFCANPDIYAFHGQDLRKCAGYFANKLKEQGGELTLWGKPNLSFYNFIEQLVPPFKKETCLMIGDTLETDILGAQQFGIASLLVLTGVSEGKRQSQALTLNQLTEKIKPTYILPRLGL